MDITVVELLVPAAPSPFAQAALLLLRVFMGICFIRHGWGWRHGLSQRCTV